MSTKKACVIFTAAKEAEVGQVVQRLSEAGYEVCTTEVEPDIAKAVKAGAVASVPTEVANCLSGAEVCVILLDQELDAFGGLAGVASDGGCRVVTVGGDPEKLPADLDDVIDGHVASSQNPDFVEIVNGRPERIKPDNSPATRRKVNKVKCQ